MKKCKFCQEELAEDVKFCSNCGKPVSEEEVSAVEEAAAPAEQTAAQEVPVEEAVSESAETVETASVEAPKSVEKKVTPGKIAMAVAAVVVLAAVLIALIVFGMNSGETAEETAPVETAVAETVAATVPADGNPEDVTCQGSYTVTDEEALAARDTVIAAIGDQQLTNGQLQVYYWSMVNSYLSSEYGYYMLMYGAIDYTQPLDTQICAEDESLTWQQYFLDEALNYWQMSQALAGEAKKNGVEVSAEDQAYLDNLPVSLQETADSYSMTLEELMRNNVGPGAGIEEFIDFQELYCAGKDFYQAELAKMVPTQEQLEQFYAEHEEDYIQSGITQDANYVDVRHILIQVEGGTTDENGATTYSDEEWAACEAEAQAILDAWLTGDKTEESFAALANEKSEDPGSNTTGGLYEDVYEGQMVAPFEEWCFDESRQYGDYGLVQTSYGYHVMFYVGSEPIWISYVESDWGTEQANQFVETLAAGYPMEVDYEKIALGFINLGG